jgi:integrase
MLGEAARLGYIPKNPCDSVKPLKKNQKERDILTKDEVEKLFDEINRESIWDNSLNRTANLLAASSGMRLGEVQGLQVEDVFDTYVQVRHNLERGGFGIKDTKTHHERSIPLPHYVLRELKNLTKGKTSGFVFSLDGGKNVVAYTTITRSFFGALYAIGISEKERKKRNITFHGWRHYFNSRLRAAGIADSKIQMLTGHKTLAMTEH